MAVGCVALLPGRFAGLFSDAKELALGRRLSGRGGLASLRARRRARALDILRGSFAVSYRQRRVRQRADHAEHRARVAPIRAAANLRVACAGGGTRTLKGLTARMLLRHPRLP